MKLFEPTETPKNSLIKGSLYGFFLILMAVAELGCAQRDLYQILLQSNLQTEGFLAPDTFQVKGYGSPLPHGSDKKAPIGLKERHRLSFQRAVAMVRGRAVQMLYQHRIKQKQQQSSTLFILPPKQAQKLKKQIFGIVDTHGRIIASEFDSAGGCRVVLRIRTAKLMQRIESLPIKMPTQQGS